MRARCTCVYRRCWSGLPTWSKHSKPCPSLFSRSNNREKPISLNPEYRRIAWKIREFTVTTSAITKKHGNSWAWPSSCSSPRLPALDLLVFRTTEDLTNGLGRNTGSTHDDSTEEVDADVAGY